MEVISLILRAILILYWSLISLVATSNIKPRIGNDKDYLLYSKTLKIKNKERLKERYYHEIFKTFLLEVVFIFLTAWCVSQTWFYWLSFLITLFLFIEVATTLSDYEFQKVFTWKEKLSLRIERIIVLVDYIFGIITIVSLFTFNHF